MYTTHTWLDCVQSELQSKTYWSADFTEQTSQVKATV